jgi:SagB-type dehydrogenase family enzyme
MYGGRGVLLDDPAEHYHESSRLYRRIAPERLDVLHELEGGSALLHTLARSARTHDHRPAIALPPPEPLGGRLGDVLARRRSVRPDVLRPLRLSELSAVLCASYAAGGRRELRRRPVPSAGALYPLELYVLATAVRGLDAGLYHFHPFRHRLCRLGPLDWTRTRGALVDATLLDTAAALVIVTALFWRSRFKYGLRGYRFALLEAGHVVQNAVLAAADLGLAALPVGGFYDRGLDALVGAEGLDEASVYAVVLGGST